MFRFIRMFKLSVWDNEGRQYLPEFDADGNVVRYALAQQAIDSLNNSVLGSLGL